MGHEGRVGWEGFHWTALKSISNYLMSAWLPWYFQEYPFCPWYWSSWELLSRRCGIWFIGVNCLCCREMVVVLLGKPANLPKHIKSPWPIKLLLMQLHKAQDTLKITKGIDNSKEWQCLRRRSSSRFCNYPFEVNFILKSI